MGNVDDSITILRVFEALGADPDLTRRSAIIRIAGEGSLRRIERKMAAIEGADPHALDTARRATIHARHATTFPVVGLEREGTVGFCARFLDGERKERTAFLAVTGSRVIASFKKAVLVTPDEGAPEIDFDLALRSFSEMSMRVINALSWYGVIRNDGWEHKPNRGGTVGWNLACTLYDAWRDAGLGGHLDPDALLAEAVEAEEARLESAGIGRLLDLFPASFSEAVSGCARHVASGRGNALLFGSMAEWVLSEPTRARYLAGFGSLALVAYNELCDRDGPISVPAAEVVFRIVRDAMVSDTRGAVTPADAAWLLTTCGPGRGMPTMTKSEARALVAHRSLLTHTLAWSQDEREALGRLLRLGTDEGTVTCRLDLWLHLARTFGDRPLSLASVVAGIDACADRNGISADEVAESILAEAPVYVATAWSMLAGEISRDLTGEDYAIWQWWRDSTERITREIEKAALALVSGGEGWSGLGDGVMAWVEAGRPGFSLSAHVQMDYVGRVSECALYDVFDGGRPDYERRRAVGEFEAFLASRLGQEAFKKRQSSAISALPVPPVQLRRDEDFEHQELMLATYDAFRDGTEDEAEAEPGKIEVLPWWRRGLDAVRILPWRRAA